MLHLLMASPFFCSEKTYCLTEKISYNNYIQSASTGQIPENLSQHTNDSKLLKNMPCYANLQKMKNKIALVSFFLLLAQIAPASEIKAALGVNSSKYLFSSEINSLNREQKTGYCFGLGWAFNLNRNIKFEIDAMYSKKGAKTSIAFTPDKTISGFYKNTAIGIPCIINYKFKEKASPYIALGPEFVFITSHHLIFPDSNGDYDLDENTKKFVLAFNAILGYELPFGHWGLFAELRYNRYLGNFLVDPEATVKNESISLFFGGVYYL